MMGWYGTGYGGIAWFGMGIFWLALIGLIVWLAIRLATQRQDHSPASPTPTAGGAPTARETPLEILDRRLANGEIDVDTYRASRDAIRDTRSESK